MSGGIKYYQLRKGEDLPSEFCAVRDENGEPSEYTWYVPEAENVKLRELCVDFDKCLDTALYLASEAGYPVMPDQKLFDSLRPRMRELRVEVDE